MTHGIEQFLDFCNICIQPWNTIPYRRRGRSFKKLSKNNLPECFPYVFITLPRSNLHRTYVAESKSPFVHQPPTNYTPARVLPHLIHKEFSTLTVNTLECTTYICK